ncbi:MAG: hypothetical protein EZS28_029828 [Streblomastix strix]|uniref:Uncharacterized protein n=1 Tax=Streblomastix strix TaxID=222440 RepID=A0A5J4UWN1_9EUKA|nr:MAG: hypothetical protein EZS28_029828 [Streblomastix strix]
MKDKESKIKQGIQLMRALRDFSQHPNYEFLFPDHYKLHEIVGPLLHIHCPKDCQCQMNFSVPYSDQVQELQGAAFSCLGQLVHNDHRLERQEPDQFNLYSNLQQGYVVQVHSGYEHIISNITQYTSNLSVTPHNSQQQYYSSPSSPIFTLQLRDNPCSLGGILHLYSSLLYRSKMHLMIATRFPNVASSMIKLARFERKVHQGTFRSKQAKEIRLRSIGILVMMCPRSYQEQQFQMVREWKVINCFIDSFSVAGGSEEQYKDMNEIALKGVYTVMTSLRTESVLSPIKPELQKESQEDCESMGGMEEIESHQFRRVKRNDLIRLESSKAKIAMLNIRWKSQEQRGIYWW